MEDKNRFTSLRSLLSALKISEVDRPDLHLCKFDRVFVALPVEPVDPLRKSRSYEKTAAMLKNHTHQRRFLRCPHLPAFTLRARVWILQKQFGCVCYSRG